MRALDPRLEARMAAPLPNAPSAQAMALPDADLRVGALCRRVARLEDEVRQLRHRQLALFREIQEILAMSPPRNLAYERILLDWA